MKKIFTLLTAFAMTATFASAETATATWTLGQKVYDKIDAVVTDGSGLSGILNKGTSLNDKGTRVAMPSTGNVTMTTWQQGIKGGFNENAYVEFVVTPSTKAFIPSKFEFDASAAKTGNGRCKVELRIGSTVKELGSDILVVRTDVDATKDADKNFHQQYDITGIESSTEIVSVRVYFYSSNTDGSAREFGLANVTLTGDVIASGEVDNRQPAPIAWPQDSYSANIGEAFDSPVLANAEDLAVTYESSNAGIATVSEDGVVTLAGEEGTAKITARYAGDADKYKPTNVSYEINVARPSQTFIVDPILKVTNAGAVDAGTTILSDENITVVSELATKGVAVNSTNICGVDFSNYVQVRAKLENGALVLDRTENSYMKITPNVNMEVAIYGRIQNNSTKVENVNQPVFTKLKNCVMYGEDMSEMSSNGFYFGSWVSQDIKNGSEVVGKNPYAFILVAQTYSLEAGKTYYLSAASFGFQLYGIGYTAEAPAEVAAPTHNQEGETVKVNGSQEVVFTTAADNHVIYTYFEETVKAPESAVNALAAAETVEHEGKTFTLAADKKVTIDKSGTLHYFAMDPDTQVKSPVNTIAFDVTTGIADIDVDSENAPVEYFNMQGIRVANPQNGLYIRRQGDKVEKVYVK